MYMYVHMYLFPIHCEHAQEYIALVVIQCRGLLVMTRKIFTSYQSAGSEGHAQQCVSGNTNKGRSECPHHTQCTAGRAIGQHHNTLNYHNINMHGMEEEGQEGGVRIGDGV